MKIKGAWRKNVEDQFVFVVELFNDRDTILDDKIFYQLGVGLLTPLGYLSNEQGAIDYCYSLWSVATDPDMPF